MGLFTKVAVAGVLAGAALAVYVQRRHSASGESYGEIVETLPDQARRAAEDIQRRAAEALREGRAAARATADEFNRQLRAGRTPEPLSWTTPREQ